MSRLLTLCIYVRCINVIRQYKCELPESSLGVVKMTTITTGHVYKDKHRQSFSMKHQKERMSESCQMKD